MDNRSGITKDEKGITEETNIAIKLEILTCSICSKESLEDMCDKCIQDTVDVLEKCMSDGDEVNVYVSNPFDDSKVETFEYEMCPSYLVEENNCIQTQKVDYTCDFCDYTNTQSSTLLKHIRAKHPNEEEFSCDECDCKFITQRQLSRHQQKHTEKLYTCVYCGYQTKYSGHLTNHIKAKHTKEKNFSCHMCDYKFVTKIQLSRHLRKHTGERPYLCEFCDYRSAQKSTLISHTRNKHMEKKFSCQLCDCNFSTRNELCEHSKQHMEKIPGSCGKLQNGSTNQNVQGNISNFDGHFLSTDSQSTEKPYACSMCDFRSIHANYLKYHIKYKHSLEGNFVCHICEQKFVTNGQLTQHIMKHTGEKPYTCTLCDYKSSYKSTLKWHIKYKHTHEKNFPCDQCDQKFVTKGQLNQHVMKHTGEKPFACEFCDYRTSQSGHLTKHVSFKHKTEKNYPCDQCEQKFVTKWQYERHSRVHTGEKPYKCEFCDYRGADSSTLRIHIKFKHTKEKKYICDNCELKFVTKGQLKKHILKHTRLFSCDLCDYKTSVSSMLKKHLKFKHKKK